MFQKTATATATLPCLYNRLANGIHEFTFMEATPRAIDLALEYATEIYRHVGPDDTLRVIMDCSRSGTPPLAYSFNALRRWVGALKLHPKVRYAYIYDNDFFLSLANTFVKTMRWGHLTNRNFKRSQYEAALAWVQEEEAHK